jgi:hypothetical protein
VFLLPSPPPWHSLLCQPVSFPSEHSSLCLVITDFRTDSPTTQKGLEGGGLAVYYSTPVPCTHLEKGATSTLPKSRSKFGALLGKHQEDSPLNFCATFSDSTSRPYGFSLCLIFPRWDRHCSATIWEVLLRFLSSQEGHFSGTSC